MAVHTHAVVWIDHREARVFHFNATDVDELVIHPDKPTHHLHHKHGSIGSGHAAEDKEYFHKVAQALSDAAAILITGPANAKKELVKHIEAHMPKLAKAVAAVETLDHPSSGEIVAHARKFFSRDHLAPPRIKR
ncbi:MAG: translational machinery protein [Hyphomicrobiaceae bacterium]|nr:translational machinery protein [Hyphomicrobiaceae bacterium]